MINPLLSLIGALSVLIPEASSSFSGMRKTTSYPSSSSDALSVDTAGLQKMLNSGRQTATQIGMAAGAKFCVGRRVYWNVAKIRKYLDEISE